MTRPEHGVVLGGGWAGMLAARALARHLESVTVVERDVLPDGPRNRRGTPQARHSHILWSGGARIVDELLPGTLGRLLAAGARRVVFQRDLITLSAIGWQHRFPSGEFAVMCSRPLLDWVVRERVLADPRVTVRPRTEAVEPLGGRDRVTGVRVRDVADGSWSSLEADLVVDASGRGSRIRAWLSGLGLPPVEEDAVDAGMAYCSRVYQAPPGVAAAFPPVNLADHPEHEPGRFGSVYPQENGRWIVTLAGTRGARLPTREEEFLPWARALPDPLVADLLVRAEPLTPVFVSRFGANRRLYPERLEQWPDGLVALGDSVAVFNPIYGHGLSAAARGAAALEAQLREPGPGWAGAAQRAVGEGLDDPWIMATSKDIGYVDCRARTSDPRLAGGASDRHRFSAFINARALRSPAVSEVATGVVALAVPPSELGSNRFLALLSKDEILPELSGPPLRPEELALAGLPARNGHTAPAGSRADAGPGEGDSTSAASRTAGRGGQPS
ncbi:NAD(P)/FAD-dependent oxidoreductase [Streptomyces boncukensis]|uniref:FAD-dependent oxidoreductase n=1 Tax=Streptomyces boncukensis TaxID=2711219 RepID=A0A6G4X3N7_9ACTN|nr:FAD-dependent oxidoreductase [Streptomyces boncukensis]NGO72156.1 FAD-dependent oxidoreductase [Streptomyces boncukensis]